jgi:hypothetical protein
MGWVYPSARTTTSRVLRTKSRQTTQPLLKPMRMENRQAVHQVFENPVRETKMIQTEHLDQILIRINPNCHRSTAYSLVLLRDLQIFNHKQVLIPNGHLAASLRSNSTVDTPNTNLTPMMIRAHPLKPKSMLIFMGSFHQTSRLIMPSCQMILIPSFRHITLATFNRETMHK